VINDRGKTTIELTDSSGANRILELANYLPKLAETRFIEQDRGLVVVGDRGPAKSLVLIDVKRGTVIMNLETQNVSVSPDSRLAVYQPFLPGKDAGEYFVLPLILGRPVSGARFFPSDSDEHLLRSRLQWVNNDTLAFLDMARHTTNLVVARFGENGNVSRLIEKPLDADTLVDASKLEGSHPEIAITGASISQLDQPGMTIRLAFAPQVSLRVRRVDVRVW
jgi:hypothetical protein